MTDHENMSTEALSQEVHHLRHEVTELSANVRDLVEAWNTARGMVRFVKFLGAIAASCTTVWALVKLVTSSRG